MSVGENVRAFLLGIFLELFLFFKPLLELVSSLEPRATFVIGAFDGVLILDNLVYLPLEIFQFVGFLDKGIQSFRDCFKGCIAITSL